MSDVTAAIRDFLESVTAVTDLVSTRIRRRRARSEDLRDATKGIQAFIVIQKLSNPREHHQGGPAGLSQSRIQINCVAKSQGLVNQISDAVETALDGLHNQTMGDDDLDVRSVALDNGPVDNDESATDASQRHIYEDRMELLVWAA